MTQHIHHIPGRLRLKFPHVKGCRHSARLVECELRKVHGVKLVQANAATGSVVIRYDIRKLDQAALFDEIDVVGNRLNPASAGTAARHQKMPSRYVARQATKDIRVGDRLLEIAVEKCIERGVVALFGILL